VSLRLDIRQIVLVLPKTLMATFTLYGIVQGDTTVFDVTVSADECVSGLKKLIHQEGKKGILHDTDAKDLSLWVVSTFQRS